jgi:outer membrane biosynthesis protein TonB
LQDALVEGPREGLRFLPMSALVENPAALRDSTLRYARENGVGFAVSALLHGLLLALILFLLSHRSEVVATASKVFSVDVVTLSDETRSPQSAIRVTSPKEASAPRGQSASVAPPVSHDASKPVVEDAFDAKLKALAQLRQPDSRPSVLNATGSDDQTFASDAPGGGATYSLKDFVRAQVLRHWNLDYSILGERRFSVPIRVEMTAKGVITNAEIVEKARYAGDAIYHEIALSAKNAVTLSSPIPLPPGNYKPVMDFVLDLDPRDTNR